MTIFEPSMSKWGSSKVTAKVPIEYERVVATPKFKQRKVSVARDFPSGCGRTTVFEPLMSKEGSSKVTAKVSTEYERVAATLNFKRCKVSAIWDFSPRCGRVTTSNFELSRQIAIDQSSQDKS
ncbi:hypothetical protein J1N35_025578 [Gossypium stocksii]|uniref:Uncharacterized protein n=1 Tax=Gossypium stocksii TaxID=47602 RepID=A0A9D3V7C0_9ROSI|nr:hypothetical protein J1N35_025578 [Gossypium stocksii]